MFRMGRRLGGACCPTASDFQVGQTGPDLSRAARAAQLIALGLSLPSVRGDKSICLQGCFRIKCGDTR